MQLNIAVAPVVSLPPVVVQINIAVGENVGVVIGGNLYQQISQWQTNYAALPHH